MRLALCALLALAVLPGCRATHGHAAQDRSIAAPILMYHRIADLPGSADQAAPNQTVSPKAFDSQLEWLRKHGYHAVTPQKLSEHLRSGAPLPPKPIVLAFDDASVEQHSAALPILKRRGMTATFFIDPARIGAPGCLTWPQLADLSRQGMDIQARAPDHPESKKPEDARRAVIEAKAILESHLNRPITTFAFFADVPDDSTIALVKSAGYRCAVGFQEGTAQTAAALYDMKRTRISNDDSPDHFARKVEGRR